MAQICGLIDTSVMFGTYILRLLLAIGKVSTYDLFDMIFVVACVLCRASLVRQQQSQPTSWRLRT